MMNWSRHFLASGLAAVLMGIVALPIHAQFHEAFDSAQPSWKRSETDCMILSSRWSQSRIDAGESGDRLERIEFQNGPGTRIFITHDVPRSLIIPELIPEVRIRSSRSGIRLMVRVVLPETASPKGNGPMTTLLPGPTYRSSGRWETLSFASEDNNLAEKLQQEIWLLRQKHGQHVSKSGAYIDKVVLNLYSGQGNTDVEIDDLKLTGRVAVTSEQALSQMVINDDEVRGTSAMLQEPGKRPSLVVRDGTVLLVKDKPFFPRIIQHNGEPFNYLKAIGFNVIELRQTVTEAQLESARDLDLWLVCPPPSSVGLQPIGFEFDRVLAWSVGEQLAGRNLPVLEQQVREIREFDQRQGRPLVGHAVADWSGVAQLTDVLSMGLEPIGTSFIASQYSDWITARGRDLGHGKPVWVDIQTELSSALVSQIGVLTPSVPPIPLEPQQIKFLCFEAITGGARGLRFRSRSRLDGVDPVTQLRALTIEWINAQLVQLEPWVVGGAVMGKLPLDPDTQNLEVTAINTNRSRLLLVQRPTHHEQYLAGDPPLTTISFHDPSSPFTDNAYWLTPAGLNSLANVRGVTGTRIQMNNCPYSAAVVLTQDPLVVNQLTRSYSPVAKQSILQMHLDLTQQWLAILQLIDSQMGRMGRSSAELGGAINESVDAFRNARQMVDQGNQTAAENYLQQADQRLATVRRELVTGPLGMFQSKTSAPLTTHCSLIPLHWELAGRLRDGKWEPNGLAGGDFEDLDHMMANGWQNRRSSDVSMKTEVELTKSAAVGGTYGLKLTVSSQSGGVRQRGLIESAPLRIQSPAVKVRAGQLVRIHGWVHVPSVIQGSMDGLCITDSLGGPDMAERIPISNGWQEFTLYRGAAIDGEISVMFELCGYGEASIDEVTIRAIELPAPADRQAKR